MSGFSVSGIGSGIDWSAYIQAVRNAKESALQRTLGKKSVKLTGQTNVFQGAQRIAQDLQTTMKGFAYQKDFLSKSVASTDKTVVTGVANLSASNASNTIYVDQLATNENWQASFSGVGSSVTSSTGTLAITVRGKTTTLTVSAGTTLQQLSDQINAAGIGVTSTIYDTGGGGATPARLSITDNLTGKSNTDQTAGVNFNLGFSSTLTDLNTASFGATPVVEGKDSKVRMNGSATSVYHDSNTFSDLIPGVSLTLVSASATQQTLTVSSSTDAGTTKINDFIQKYNTLITELKKATFYDVTLASAGKDQTNPTAGNAQLRDLIDQMQAAVLGSVNSLPQDRTVRSLTDAGIRSNYTSAGSNDNGTLTLDSTKLSSAMASNYDDLVDFFYGVTTGGVTYDGFSQKVIKALDGFLDPVKGSLPAAIKSIASQNLRLSDDTQKKLDQIQRQEDNLKARFARLETQLAALNSRGDQINSMFSALTGSSGKKKSS